MYDDNEAPGLGRDLAPYYYAFVIRGLVLIGFGICFIFFPVTSWATLSFIFGAMALADAFFNLSGACIVGCSSGIYRKCQVMSMFLLSGVCSGGIGYVSIAYPSVTAEALLFMLALWFIYIGVAQFWFACLMANENESGNSCCIGLIAMIFLVTGVTIMMDLQGNVDFFILFVGLTLNLFGIQLIFLGFNIKKIYKSGEYAPIGEAMNV